MAESESKPCVEEKSSLSNSTFIREGDSVILKKGKSIRVFQVIKKRQVWLDKIKFTLDGVIGHHYGSTFEVKKGEMFKVTRCFKEDEVIGSQQGKDNRDLHDSDTNQKLSREDIEKLKKDGAKGQEIIGHLIENSTTFKAKTEFAQEKWVKKKKQKHVSEFTVLKPSARLLCDMYYQKGPAKILYIRQDTLAQMLLHGNVRAHTNVMVVDTCCGLLVGAVLEKMGGFGKVIHFHPGDVPIRPVVENLDFSKKFLDNLYTVPLTSVSDMKSDQTQDNNDSPRIKVQKSAEETDCSEDKVKTSDTAVADESGDQTVIESKIGNKAVDGVMEDMETKSGKDKGSQKREFDKNSTQRVINKKQREKQIQEAKQILQEQNIDSLIVASKFYPTPIVLALLDYVAPSRPVVVYSQYKEAVMDCYAYMREKGGLVNYRVSESWLRDYQVLPMRTHPVIQMSSGGGFLLTATTVVMPTNK